MGEDMRIVPQVLLGFSLQDFFYFLSRVLCTGRKSHGKFPHGGEHAFGWTEVEEYFSLADADGAGGGKFLLRFFRRAIGKALGISMFQRLAEIRNGTGFAAGMLGDANFCAQVHEGFIEIAGSRGKGLLYQRSDFLFAGAF